jgi:hypothetical protein
MNISVQEILNKIKVGKAQTEDDVLNDINVNRSVEKIIPKINFNIL